MNNFMVFLKNNFSLLVIFTPYLLKKPLHKALMLISLFLIVCNIIFSAYLPLLFGELVNKAADRTGYLLYPFLGYGLLWIINSVFMQVRAMLGWHPFRHAMKEFLESFFKHILNLPLSFHNENNVGKIITLFNKVEFSLISYFWHTYYYIIPLVLEISLICGFIYYASSLYYTALLLSGICLFVFFTIYFSKNDTLLLEESNTAFNNLGDKITDKLYNIEIIKYFNSNKNEVGQISRLLHNRECKSLKADIHFEKIFLIQHLVLGFTLLIFIVSSYLDYYHGKLDLSVLIMLNAYVIRVSTPLSYLGYVIREIKYSSTHIQEIIQILKNSYTQPIVDGETINSYEIEFFNVSATKQNKSILKNINFKIKENETIGIVGSSGSGKTTLTNLLMNLDKNYEGQIFIGGKKLEEISTDYYNSIISIAIQDHRLFNETLLYNLTYGNPNASPEQIQHIIQMTLLEEKISKLENGLQTNVNQQGINFSGGEKQRIAIARALMKDAHIYIFDEITSNLDPKNSNQIYLNIIKNLPNATKIFVSHKDTIIKKCDIVYFINNGQIEDSGTHLHLLKNNKDYKKVWQIKEP